MSSFHGVQMPTWVTKEVMSSDSKPVERGRKPKSVIVEAPRPSTSASAVYPELDSPSQEASSSTVPVPEDPGGLIPDGPAAELLSHSGVVVARQLEMLNVFLGFEQANRYVLSDAQGQTLGFLAESDTSTVGAIGRQLLRNHRPFRTTVMSPSGEILFRVRRQSRLRLLALTMLQINRPFAFINSKTYISLGEDESNVIGFVQQEWHLFRRRYNLFQRRDTELEQFARIDAPLLSWDFVGLSSPLKICV